MTIDHTKHRPAPGDPFIGTVGGNPVYYGRFTYGVEFIKMSKSTDSGGLSIGQFCSISKYLTISLLNEHRTDWITTFPFGHVFEDHLVSEPIPGHPASKGRITIGNDVWIAANVTILSGVTVGDGAVLAANSTVAKDVGPYEIHGGNPARLIRKRFDDKLIDLLLELRWWDLPVDSIVKIHKDLCREPTEDLLKRLISEYRTADRARE